MAAVSLHSVYGRLTQTTPSPPLNTCTVQQPRANLSRIHMLLHFAVVAALLYYRVSNLIAGGVPFLPWSLITLAEVIFTFVWITAQPFRWRPVARTVAPENLKEERDDADLPAVDVFVCTADPKKEPVVDVMNTVVSAMALDYPAEKLAVYLSDDGGAAVTLGAMREAGAFAREWIPFCRRFGVKTRCPEAFFSSFGESERELLEDTVGFKVEQQQLESKYEVFKRNVEKAAELEDSVNHDRPSYIEVIYDNKTMETSTMDDDSKLPLLVYVSREKRPSYPHRFKAGALNALLRVSGIMSNAPYALVLDCDMYCNDPTSAKQAMCFHLDSELSNKLSYVQFPQIFYNVSKNDIYDGQARSAYKTKYQGMDGIRGTVCAGTGYYLNKKALFCSPDNEDEMLQESEKKFGSSRELIESLQQLNGKNVTERKSTISEMTLEEAKKLASCAYEQTTRWGKDIGYSYDCLLESTFTGYLMHCKGWKSVYLYPDTPGFLGCTTIDMKDALVQLMKWASGLVQVGLSRFSPLTYGMSSRMPALQSLCYGYFVFCHFLSIACFLYGFVPQLCFLFGISLFPKVTSPWFAAFATVFLSSMGQHLYEVLSTGGSIRTMWNEQRIWMIKSVTACLFGCTDVLVKYAGMAKANFRLTNKAVDEEKLESYEKGKFNFQGAGMFMVPLTMLVLLNMGCLLGGLKALFGRGDNFGEMFGQGLLLAYVGVLSVPILEGLVPKFGK